MECRCGGKAGWGRTQVKGLGRFNKHKTGVKPGKGNRKENTTLEQWANYTTKSRIHTNRRTVNLKDRTMTVT